MLIRTEKSQEIIDFLKEDLLINLNILGILENVPEAEVFVDNLRKPTGVFVKKGYFHYLYSKEDDFIQGVLDSFTEDGYYGFSGVEESIAEKIKERYKVNWENPCILYHMPKENLDLSRIKHPVESIRIEDAEIVDQYYQFRNDFSLEAIRRDIQDRPSSAVYVDGELACWLLIHDDNSMGIMYTKEAYRKKGYAVDVTLDLAAKIFQKGEIPFLQIVDSNIMSPGLAAKCKFEPCGKVNWLGIVVGTPPEWE